MPLIIAHPAAVIPLAKPLGRWSSLSALIIGSMVPDFAYVLPLGVVRMQTHGPLALLWFSLPVGLATYFLFHTLLAPACARLLPDPIACRLPPSVVFGHLPKIHVGVVMACILVGAFSHLAVDSITHRDGYIARLLPFLQIYIGRVGGSRIYVCKLLQYIFSIAGMAFIATWVRDWTRRTSPAGGSCHRISRRLRVTGLCLLFAIPVTAGILAAVTRPPLSHRVLQFQDRARTFMKAGATALLVGWLALGITLRHRHPPGPTPQ